MGKLSIDLNSLKAAGIYTLEVDNTKTALTTNVQSLRMVTGFANKGPFNRPVLLNDDNDRIAIFGEIDPKLEYKGCFFNRALRTALSDGPVIALNLLNVSTSYSGPDQTNFVALSLDAGSANPRVIGDFESYGEYDYLAESLDNILYGTTKGANIPFVGKTPFANVYNRSRFWVPDKDLLTATAEGCLKTITGDSSEEKGTYEHSNLLNFANVGTEEISILVYKPSNVNGYDVTAESWYGGKENIPYGWIRPYDYISDYFVNILCVKGNWTNYSILSTDPIWGAYFDKKGIIKNKIGSFSRTEGITILGSWSGCIIPDFIDKQGSNLSVEKKVNAATERTGLLMSFNNDAANVLMYDYSGIDSTSEDPYTGSWGLDIDGDSEASSSEGKANYIVDMCGHGAFANTKKVTPQYEDAPIYGTIPANSSIWNSARRKVVSYSPEFDINCISNTSLKVEIGTNDGSTYVPYGIYVDSNLLNNFEPLVDPSAFTENIVANIVSNKYYNLSEQGTLSSKKQGIIKSVSIEDISTNIADASITMIYGSEERLINFKVGFEYFNVKKFITDASNATMKVKKEEEEKTYSGINFLSYNYIHEEDDGVQETLEGAYYFSDPTLWEEYEGRTIPVEEDNKSMFIIDSSLFWKDANIKVGDYVHNITYKNEIGQTAEYKLIPGLARVIKKQFVQVKNENGSYIINYKGKTYKYTKTPDTAENGYTGFYLLTTTAPVLIEEDNTIIRQLAINEDAISHSLRFMPMKGLTISSRHRPGYDKDGALGIEAGIKKIYGVLQDSGIHRGLMNKAMVNYRYIVDTMSYGLEAELGGKVELSKIAYDRGKVTAVLSLPSAKQFSVSSNPCFCDTYTPGVEARKPLNTKYIPEGGNSEMGSTIVFSLPTEEDGAAFTACFWPNLIYTENGKNVSVPPAADACNVLNRKFIGVNDNYAICANMNGIISNKYVTDIEFNADIEDRKVLEPFGVNTIIKENGNIMIYGNQTAYQSMKSDLNKLHVRENLNTLEIDCETVLQKYNFLYNTPATRANIVQQLTPILQAAQTSGALSKYKITCDETNNTEEVINTDTCIVNVDLWMSHGMEKIVQVFTLNRYSDSNE